jgi:hypothetical protein
MKFPPDAIAGRSSAYEGWFDTHSPQPHISNSSDKRCSDRATRRIDSPSMRSVTSCVALRSIDRVCTWSTDDILVADSSTTLPATVGCPIQTSTQPCFSRRCGRRSPALQRAGLLRFAAVNCQLGNWLAMAHRPWYLQLRGCLPSPWMPLQTL